MDISFKFDPELAVGADTLSMAGTICVRYGDKIMIAADSAVDSQTVNRLKEILEDSGVKAIVFDGIQDDSTVEMADNIVQLSNAAHCTALVGFGGLKAQIISRMAAIIAPSGITACDLFDGHSYQNKTLPLISIPTADVDPFIFTDCFIAADPRSRLVKAVPSPSKLYSAVIIDSALFHSFTGGAASVSVLDGFSTAMEAYCSSRANFLSDAILERALTYYAKLLKGGESAMNADTFAQASFLTSFGAAASSPGVISALSAAINARFPAAKQQCAAALLPHVAEKLASARPEKMARVATYLGNTGKAATVADGAKAAPDGIRRYMETLMVSSSLKEFDINLDKITAAAEAARSLEFVANSSWTVSSEDMFDILKKIIN